MLEGQVAGIALREQHSGRVHNILIPYPSKRFDQPDRPGIAALLAAGTTVQNDRIPREAQLCVELACLGVCRGHAQMDSLGTSFFRQCAVLLYELATPALPLVRVEQINVQMRGPLLNERSVARHAFWCEHDLSERIGQVLIPARGLVRAGLLKALGPKVRDIFLLVSLHEGHRVGTSEQVADSFAGAVVDDKAGFGIESVVGPAP
jgi:hypothetical protein